MRIPESWLDRYGNASQFWSRLEPAQTSEHRIADFNVRLFYQRPRAGCSYGCSPPDILRILTEVAPSLSGLPDMIGFRQPTRNERQLSPVWGRFVYLAQIGPYQGPAIILEAQEVGALLSWPKRLSLEDRAELERLRNDGHVFRQTRRGFEARLSEQALRKTLLYRTLLHEIGHWVQYHSDVLDPATALDPDPQAALDMHVAKPTAELEVAAHRFADRCARELRSKGTIPFAPCAFKPER